MHHYLRIHICVYVRIEWSIPISFAQIPVFFAKNFLNVGFF